MAASALGVDEVGKNHRRGPVLLAFFCVTFLLSCAKKDLADERYLIQVDGKTMGSTYSVKALAPEALEGADKALAAEIDAALATYNLVMSTYIDGSEISRVNGMPVGEWIAISDALQEILQLSQRISAKSGGAFDITVGPLVNLWGFGPEEREAPPGDDQVAVVRSLVGYEKLVLATGKLKKRADLYLDLSAIAKGHATDLVASLLESKNIRDYMVEIGGELKIRGRNPRGESWIIGIEKPALGREGAMQAVSGDNIAIATSGDYRNYYEAAGVRVSHTIDPVSGFPIRHNLASVTVIAARGGVADAYATAINVLGPEAGYALALRENLAAFFIIRNNGAFTVKYTAEFERYMVQ